MIFYRERDEHHDFRYALEWRRSVRRPDWLYWSAWVGWTPDVHQALTITWAEVEDIEKLSAGPYLDVLPIKAAGMWEPVFRLIPLFEDDE